MRHLARADIQAAMVSAGMAWAFVRHKHDLEHTGKDGGPVQVEERKMLDITALSWEQRDQLQQILLTVDPDGAKDT